MNNENKPFKITPADDSPKAKELSEFAENNFNNWEWLERNNPIKEPVYSAGIEPLKLLVITCQNNQWILDMFYKWQAEKNSPEMNFITTVVSQNNGEPNVLL